MEEKATKWQKIETHLIKWMLGIATTGIITSVGFYFNTNYVMSQNTSDIKVLKEEIKKVTTVPVLNQNKIRNIEKEIKEFKETYKENNRENKENIKEMRKEMQKMMELLYQINRKTN